MFDDWSVYVAFRHAQSMSKGKPYRLPKDWETFKKTRMSPKNLEFINKTVDCFNTKWHNVDLNDYMQYGFELWKNFSYHQFLNSKLIEYYIRKTKIKVRSIRISREIITESMKFIKLFMKDKSLINGYSVIETYCKLRDGQSRIVVKHFLQGKIDKLTMAYLINKGYLTLNDNERPLMSDFISQYRELIYKSKELSTFFSKIESKL